VITGASRHWPTASTLVRFDERAQCSQVIAYLGRVREAASVRLPAVNPPAPLDAVRRRLGISARRPAESVTLSTSVVVLTMCRVVTWTWSEKPHGAALSR
jgi:hypothetical protein